VARRGRREPVRLDLAVMDLDQLAGFNVAHDFGAKQVQCAGFGDDEPAFILAPEAERPHTVGIAGGEDAVITHHHQ